MRGFGSFGKTGVVLNNFLPNNRNFHNQQEKREREWRKTEETELMLLNLCAIFPVIPEKDAIELFEIEMRINSFEG